MLEDTHTFAFDSLDDIVGKAHFNINSEIPIYYKFNDPFSRLTINARNHKNSNFDQKYSIDIEFQGPLKISNKKYMKHKFFSKNKAADSSDITWISISSKQSWSELNKIVWRQYQKIYNQDLPNKFQEVANKALLIKDEYEQIKYILSAVNEIINYDKRSSGSAEGYLPRSLKEIEESGYGDCKDIAAVIALILNRVGCSSAKIVMVDSGSSKDSLLWGIKVDFFNKFLYKTLPNMKIFNHAVVMIEDKEGEKHWIDPEYGNIYKAPAFILNKYALVIDGKSGLVQITHKTILDKINEGFKEGFIDRVGS